MTAERADEGRLLAHRCSAGHVTYPGHAVCPECGRDQTDTVNLTEKTATVLTWTESVATPSGVRAPNTLAIASFALEGDSVNVLGQTTEDVEIGDTVRLVFVDELRDPDESLREKTSQQWSGYRFEPVE